MGQLAQLLGKTDRELLEQALQNAPKTSIGRELMNNLVERLNRQGNMVIEMQGHYIKHVQIKLSSNFFEPTEKNFSIWVKPFITGKYLMFNWNGVIIKASDVFGNSINRVTL